MLELVIEDGNGVADADTYVSLEEADLYHEKMGNEEWTVNKDAVKKASCLRRAAKYLDGYYGVRASGLPKDPDQGLEFPRICCYYVNGTPVDPDSVPTVYKDAQCEVALLALKGVSLTAYDDGGPHLKRRKIDALEKEWFESSYGRRPIFGWIDTILAGLFPIVDDDALQIGRAARA